MKSGSYPVIFLLLLVSCATQEVCDDDDQSLLVARFKTTTSQSIKDSTLQYVTIYGIRENMPDSLLYDSATTSRILLPLDPHQTFSRFVLKVETQTDTIRIGHANEFYLISYTCGFAARYSVEAIDVTGSLIHDAEIINAVIDADLQQNEEHLWLYF